MHIDFWFGLFHSGYAVLRQISISTFTSFQHGNCPCSMKSNLTEASNHMARPFWVIRLLHFGHFEQYYCLLILPFASALNATDKYKASSMRLTGKINHRVYGAMYQVGCSTFGQCNQPVLGLRRILFTAVNRELASLRVSHLKVTRLLMALSTSYVTNKSNSRNNIPTSIFPSIKDILSKCILCLVMAWIRYMDTSIVDICWLISIILHKANPFPNWPGNLAIQLSAVNLVSFLCFPLVFFSFINTVFSCGFLPLILREPLNIRKPDKPTASADTPSISSFLLNL